MKIEPVSWLARIFYIYAYFAHKGTRLALIDVRRELRN